MNIKELQITTAMPVMKKSLLALAVAGTMMMSGTAAAAANVSVGAGTNVTIGDAHATAVTVTITDATGSTGAIVVTDADDILTLQSSHSADAVLTLGATTIAGGGTINILGENATANKAMSVVTGGVIGGTTPMAAINVTAGDHIDEDATFTIITANAVSATTVTLRHCSLNW